MRRFGKKAVAGLAALIAVSALALTGQSAAEGTETLGAPGITIAPGTGVVTAGTGLVTQPGSISVAVPAGATVKQVLLYWEGSHYEGDAPDNSLVVKGQNVVGNLIGGPTFFFPDFDSNPPRQVFSTAFRADITGLNAVVAGPNTIPVTGMNFSYRNDGAGVAVIYDAGGASASIGVRDGVDTAFAGFPSPRDTTVPQTYTFAPDAVARTANVSVMVASVSNAGRGNSIDVTVAGNTTTFTNALNSNDGAEWDDLTVQVPVPAGASSATVQVRSSGTNPASLVWVSGIVSLASAAAPPPPPVCPRLSSTPAVTHGSGYAADATLLALHPLNKVAGVSTVAPGTPANAAKQIVSASVLNLANLGLLSASSNSSLNPSVSTATGTVANVNLLNGLVTAESVHGVSQSVATTTSSSRNSAGSNIVGLRVNNAAVVVAPNTSVAVKLGLLTVANLRIYEETGTSTFAAGVSSASHSVNMLRLTLLAPLYGLPAGSQITLGHAQSDAQSPIDLCQASTHLVSGEAFTARVNGSLGGQQFTNLKVGSAVLPATGGANSDAIIVNIPGVAQTATVANTTSGTVLPTPDATSRSLTQGVNVLGGLVTADVLDVRSTSAANGTTAGTTFATTFVNLKVGGVLVAANVAPNSVIIVQLAGGNYLSVTLNEQVTSTIGGTDTEGTVNAVHARLFLLGGVLAGDVIVASAHSDAHM